MDCKICEVKQRQFYCENCLKTQDDHVSKANRALAETMTQARLSRATLAACQRQVEERKRKDVSAAKVQTSSASAIHSATSSPSPPPPREAENLFNLSSIIARACSGLVQELVEVFNVVETKGEWTIGDLILPVPGDMRRFPPDHINAVLTRTIPFLSLLTFYLGIKLPFELDVGHSWIGVTKGTETGGWARRISHTQSSPSSTTTTHHPSVSASTKLHDSTLVASVPAADQAPSSLQSSLTTVLSMLLYNVSYLAYTQSIDVPLSQAGDVLSNLWLLCCSAELGRSISSSPPFRLFLSFLSVPFLPFLCVVVPSVFILFCRNSHSIHPALQTPTPPSFPLLSLPVW
ncbi:UV radiation resistance protein and autophagy-related subunit 14-domain-containing protein [Flammula alnicola]|nr:UV radiation resistance protein and autophagy-related subunit 14-domain-containing protein [Flammula alnicola]